MATLASSLVEDVPRLIKVEVVKEPSIEAKVKNFIISMPKPCCMDLIVEFLTENRLPNDVKKPRGCKEFLLGFGILGIIGYIEDLLGVLSYCASILAKLMKS